MQRLKPIIHQVPQRSSKWFGLRLGKVTGSEAKKTTSFSTGRYTPTKAQFAEAEAKHAELQTDPARLEWLFDNDHLVEYCLLAGVEMAELGERKSYRENMVGERLTGLQADPEGYVSYDMKWGMVNEDMAIMAYQIQQRCIVEKAGFYEYPDAPIGISPDGIVTDTTTGEVGLAEVKCLRSANHLFKIIETQEVPKDYYDQIQLQMWVAGYDWCDFIGYDSRLPDGLKIFTKRVPYDEQYLEWYLLPNIDRFLKEAASKERYFRKLIREGKNQNEKGVGYTAAEVVATPDAPKL